MRPLKIIHFSSGVRCRCPRRASCAECVALLVTGATEVEGSALWPLGACRRSAVSLSGDAGYDDCVAGLGCGVGREVTEGWSRLA